MKQATNEVSEDLPSLTLDSGSYNQTFALGNSIEPIVVSFGGATTSLNFTIDPVRAFGGQTFPINTSMLLNQSGNTITLTGTYSSGPFSDYGTYNGTITTISSGDCNEISQNFQINVSPQGGTISGGTTTGGTTSGGTTSGGTTTQAGIYFENGTCKCPNATAGDTEVISGVTYTVVDNSTIAGQIANGNVNLCTSKVTNMSGLFNSKISFNSNINSWDTSNVTDMNAMFYYALSFNQNISNWDTSNVINMHGMFRLTRDFNQNIGSWNTSSVKVMSYMFAETSSFNQDIGNWNTSNLVEDNNLSGGGGVFYMFYDAALFNQNLSGWCVTNISSEPSNFATNSALTNANKPVWGTCP